MLRFLNAMTEEPVVIEVLWDLRYWVIETFSLTGNGAAFATLGAALLCILLPYLLGSINPAIIISGASFRDDVRKHGSGNAGTTNMLRTYGKKAAVAVFALDMLKGAVAVLLGRLLFGIDGGALAGFFVAFGHMFPVYYKFRGGKGVACLATVILVISPITFLFLLGVFLVVAIGTRMVSLASVMCALLYPLILRAFANYGLNVAMAVLATCFVVYMHRENLKRIWNGTESKLDFNQFKIKRKKNGDAGKKKDGSEGEDYE